MIRLLRKEEPIADLRRGWLQTLSEDLFSQRNMVLTNKRLWIIDKKLFAYSTSIVYLRDITTVEAVRTFDVLRCIIAIFFILVALYNFFGAFVCLGLNKGEAALCWGGLAVFFLGVGAVWALKVSTSSIFITTSMNRIHFRLSLNFPTRKIETFVNRVQEAMSEYKE